MQNIITAKVLEWHKHPNADRLRIVKVDAGPEHGIIEPVVCGATNFDVGDIVVLALPGAHIAQNIHSETHEPFILDKAVIRGIQSQGMLCAAFELGLSSEPEPIILVLPSGTLVGSEFQPQMV